jgi:CPA2 family monovalent cation:H+ antiporter-2
VKLLLTTVVLSMFFTPFLNDLGSKIASSIDRRSGKILLPSPDDAEASDYILICGFGRVGKAVAELLTAKLIRWKSFDMDPYRVAEAREKGLPVFYGDATRPEVIQVFIKEETSSMSGVVVALDSERSNTRSVRSLRRLYPSFGDMPIFVRANDEKHRRKLAASGATALETGPQESALLLGGALLSSMGLPKEEVVSLIDEKRVDLYASRMKDVYADNEEEGKRMKSIFGSLAKSPAQRAAEKATEIKEAEKKAIEEMEEEIEKVEKEAAVAEAAELLQDAADEAGGAAKGAGL